MEEKTEDSYWQKKIVDRFQCKMCDYNCQLFIQLQFHEYCHIQDSADTTVHKTKYSSMTFGDIKGAISTNRSLLSCDVCDYTCDLPIQLKFHKFVHKDNPVTEKVQDRSIIQDVEVKIEKYDPHIVEVKCEVISDEDDDNSENSSLVCSTCNWEFSSLAHLQLHAVIQHGIRRIRHDNISGETADLMLTKSPKVERNTEICLTTKEIGETQKTNVNEKLSCQLCSYKCKLYIQLKIHRRKQHERNESASSNENVRSERRTDFNGIVDQLNVINCNVTGSQSVLQEKTHSVAGIEANFDVATSFSTQKCHIDNREISNVTSDTKNRLQNTDVHNHDSEDKILSSAADEERFSKKKESLGKLRNGKNSLGDVGNKKEVDCHLKDEIDSISVSDKKNMFGDSCSIKSEGEMCVEDSTVGLECCGSSFHSYSDKKEVSQDKTEDSVSPEIRDITPEITLDSGKIQENITQNCFDQNFKQKRNVKDLNKKKEKKSIKQTRVTKHKSEIKKKISSVRVCLRQKMEDSREPAKETKLKVVETDENFSNLCESNPTKIESTGSVDHGSVSSNALPFSCDQCSCRFKFLVQKKLHANVHREKNFVIRPAVIKFKSEDSAEERIRNSITTDRNVPVVDNGGVQCKQEEKICLISDVRSLVEKNCSSLSGADEKKDEMRIDDDKMNIEEENVKILKLFDSHSVATVLFCDKCDYKCNLWIQLNNHTKKYHKDFCKRDGGSQDAIKSNEGEDHCIKKDVEKSQEEPFVDDKNKKEDMIKFFCDRCSFNSNLSFQIYIHKKTVHNKNEISCTDSESSTGKVSSKNIVELTEIDQGCDLDAEKLYTCRSDVGPEKVSEKDSASKLNADIESCSVALVSHNERVSGDEMQPYKLGKYDFHKYHNENSNVNLDCSESGRLKKHHKSNRYIESRNKIKRKKDKKPKAGNKKKELPSFIDCKVLLRESDKLAVKSHKIKQKIKKLKEMSGLKSQCLVKSNGAFSCDVCNFTCSLSIQLSVHKNIHFGESKILNNLQSKKNRVTKIKGSNVTQIAKSKMNTSQSTRSIGSKRAHSGKRNYIEDVNKEISNTVPDLMVSKIRSPEKGGKSNSFLAHSGKRKYIGDVNKEISNTVPDLMVSKILCPEKGGKSNSFVAHSGKRKYIGDVNKEISNTVPDLMVSKILCPEKGVKTKSFVAHSGKRKYIGDVNEEISNEVPDLMVSKIRSPEKGGESNSFVAHTGKRKYIEDVNKEISNMVPDLMVSKIRSPEKGGKSNSFVAHSGKRKYIGDVNEEISNTVPDLMVSKIRSPEKGGESNSFVAHTGKRKYIEDVNKEISNTVPDLMVSKIRSPEKGGESNSFVAYTGKRKYIEDVNKEISNTVPDLMVSKIRSPEKGGESNSFVAYTGKRKYIEDVNKEISNTVPDLMVSKIRSPEKGGKSSNFVTDERAYNNKNKRLDCVRNKTVEPKNKINAKNENIKIEDGKKISKNCDSIKLKTENSKRTLFLNNVDVIQDKIITRSCTSKQVALNVSEDAVPMNVEKYKWDMGSVYSQKKEGVNFAFNNNSTDIHKCNPHRKKVFECDRCNYKSALSERMERHKLSHEYGSFTCQYCRYNTQSWYALRNHLKFHDEFNSYLCRVCGFKYKFLYDLEKHMLTHLNHKPFVCNKCGLKLAQKNDLKKHQMKQIDKRPLVCKICEYTTEYECYFYRHQMVHNGEKLYRCNLCSYIAKRFIPLRIHREMKHGIFLNVND